MADAAYAAGLALIGASHYTAPRPLPKNTPIFYEDMLIFKCLANLAWGPRANVGTSHII